MNYNKIKLLRKELSELLITEKPINNSQNAAENFLDLIPNRIEIFRVIYVDVKNREITRKDFHGTIDRCCVFIREIFRTALLCDASKFFVGHNHPSGDSIPSEEDLHLTTKLKKIADMLDIFLLDHIIVSSSSEYSFAENGKL